MRAIVILGAVMAGAAASFAQGDVRCVQLPVSPTDAAIHAGTGAVAVIADGAVTLLPKGFFDATGAASVGPVRIEGQARCVTFVSRPDGDVLLVGTAEQPRIVVLDARTLEVKGPAIMIPGEQGVMDLATPTDDGVVYASAVMSGENASLARINGRTLSVEGLVQADTYLGNANIESSADGAWVFAWQAGAWPPSPMSFRVSAGGDRHAWRLDQERPERRDSDPQGVPVVGGWGQFVGVGTGLFDGTMQTSGVTLPGRAVAAFRDRPMVICVQDAVVSAVSANSMGVVGQAVLPEACGWGASTSGRRRSSAGAGPVMGLADQANGRVILVQGSTATVVPLDAMNASAREPALGVVVRGSASFVSGRAGVVDVSIADPSVKVEIASGPTGMTVAGGQLRWTPGDDQIGDHTINLTLRAGEASRTHAVEVSVIRDGIDLPFPAQAVAMSPDGQRAVAWRVEQAHSPRRTGPTSRVCVVDLVRRVVVSQAEFAQGVQSAGIDATNVYVAFSEGNVIVSMNPANLRETQRIFLKHDVRSITSVDGRLLFAQGNGQCSVLVLPGFTEAKPHELPPGAGVDSSRLRSTDSALVALPGGWAFRGVVYDEAMRTPRLITSQAWSNAGPTLVGDRGSRGSRMDSYMPAPWQRRVSGTQISTVSGRTSVGSGRFESAGSALLTSRPVVVSLVVERDDGSGRVKARTAQLVLRELLTGTSGGRPVVLSRERVRRGRGYESFTSSEHLIAAVGDRVAVVDRIRLYDVTITDEDVSHAAAPFEILPHQTSFAIAHSGITELRHEIRGGSAPVEFELEGGFPWMTLDSSTGAIRVDNVAALAGASSQVKSMLGHFGGHPGVPGSHDGGSDGPRRAAIENLRGQLSAAYTGVTGNAPTGIVVRVPVSVSAKDRSSQTASLDYALLIDVPVEPVLAEIDREMEEIRRRQEAERAQWESRASQVSGGGGTEDHRERLRKLEDRVQSLEAKIDLLMQMLQNRAGDPAPR